MTLSRVYLNEYEIGLRAINSELKESKVYDWVGSYV